MQKPISEIKGATKAIATALKEQGITNSMQLLDAAKTPKQRKELAGSCGCPTREILELANRADLARLKGIGVVYSDLLEHAGVDTVKELRHRRPDNLHAKILEVNEAQNLTKQPPPLTTVEDWVAQAKELEPVIEY